MKTIASLLYLLSAVASAAPSHSKQVIGYLTQWEAWKGEAAGFSVKGEATHLNVNMDIYSILNFSFFGVAKDGSLHSGDFRNPNIYQDGAMQEPAPLLNGDVYSSWDLHILWGELEYLFAFPGSEAEQFRRVQEQGFFPQGDGWGHESGISGPFPIPLKKEGGAPGLLDLAHSKGVKVMAAIGGWSMSKHFREMAADDAMKSRFLQDIDVLVALGFDGIDIDWEYPGSAGMNFVGGPEDFDNFELMMEDIRQLIGPDKLLTAAFSASGAKLEGFDWTRLDNSMDYFNMMTYDFNGGWSNVAGHNAPLYDYPEEEDSTLNLDHLRDWMAAKGIPSEKINFGAAFYGRGVQTAESTAYLGAPTDKRLVVFSVDGPAQSAVDLNNWAAFEGQPNYNFLVQQTNDWTHVWDAYAEVPYAVKGKYFLSYDDEASIAKKAQYIMDNDLGGIIVWQVAGDIKCEGTFIDHGTKLKECTDLSSPLAEQIDAVFSQNMNGDVTENSPPVLTVPTTIDAGSGESLVIQVSATDADGDSLTFSSSFGTLSQNGNQASIIYQTPIVQSDTEVRITITVTDGVHHDSGSVAVRVSGETGGGEASSTWDPTSVYVGGVEVVHYGFNDTAQSWTQGEKPALSVVGKANGGGDSAWDPQTPYVGGDEVVYDGVRYRAKWWTQGEVPGVADVWEQV